MQKLIFAIATTVAVTVGGPSAYGSPMHAGNGAAIGQDTIEASATVSRIINNRLGDNPNYRLLGKEISGLGVANLKISNSDYGIENATPEQADLIYRNMVRERAGVADDDQYSVLAVPPNAFTVTTVTYEFIYSGGNSDKIELHWNVTNQVS